MEDITSCPNIKKCNHCDYDHLSFDNNCLEYKFQKEILNTIYTNKTSFRNSKYIIQPNDKSCGAAIKTTTFLYYKTYSAFDLTFSS